MVQKYVPAAPGICQGTPADTIFPVELVIHASTCPMTAPGSRRPGTTDLPVTTTDVPTSRHPTGEVLNPAQSMCEEVGVCTRCTARCGVGFTESHPAITMSARVLIIANGPMGVRRRCLTIRRYSKPSECEQPMRQNHSVLG